MTDTQTELTDEQQQVATVYQHVLKRGRRQAELVKAMVEHDAGSSGDLDAGIRAARRTAGFVAAEGWVVGRVWAVNGPQWLLARWALDHDVTSADIGRRMAELRGQARDKRASGGDRGSNAAAAGSSAASPAVRGRNRELVRRRREAEAMDVLFQHLLAGDRGVEDAMEAAQRTAQFAIEEKWVSGSLWHAYGMQLILARWAVGQGVSPSDIDMAMAARREPAAGV